MSDSQDLFGQHDLWGPSTDRTLVAMIRETECTEWSFVLRVHSTRKHSTYHPMSVLTMLCFKNFTLHLSRLFGLGMVFLSAFKLYCLECGTEREMVIESLKLNEGALHITLSLYALCIYIANTSR